MSENYWWSSHGPFPQWRECPTRPDPGEVLLFYLEKAGIPSEEHVSYLIKLLGLQKSTVYNILKGEGLDMISRCRELVQALEIPPPLLGIDAKYYPIAQHAYWWKKHGYTFHADVHGYPVISQVIAYLRMQRTQIEEGGRVKVWSQEDLGEATGFKKETIYRMEHEKNPLILESMSRRSIVASALGVLAGDWEPTLLRLFGLDPQAYGVPVPAHEPVPDVHFLPKRLTDETLLGYHRQQAAFFDEYSTRHAHNAAGDALEWLRRGPSLLSRVESTAQRISVLALESRYHQFLLLLASEQQYRESVIFHAGEAVKLAESATALPESSDAAGLRTTKELLAAALSRTAIASYELGQYDLAQTSIQEALDLLRELHSKQLKRQILLDAALIHAKTASSPIDQQLVLSFFNQAANLAPASGEPDDNYVRCGKGMLYLRKAMALSIPNMKGASGESIMELLEDAQRSTPPELMRQQTLIEVYLALDLLASGDCQQATDVALMALEKSRQIHSRLARDRIFGLYQQLLNTSFRDKPCLSYLGMRLRTWDRGMDS